MRRAYTQCRARVAAGTPSRSTLSVLRTARRPLSDGSGGAVRFAEIKEMPEAVRAVERETDVVDGAPLFVEREATRRVVEALERRAANPDEGDGLDADADFTCPNCGFTTFASRSFRLTCAKCGRCRDELPPRDAYLLTGARGAGKSVALAQIVTQARARGWLCLFVARARDVGHHGDYVVPSPHHAGRFEEPSRSREVLEAFREAHGTDLATVKCTAAAAERWGGATLREVVGAALDDKKRGDEASTALADVVDGLRAHAAAPVLIAVDEYSALFEPATAYYYDGVSLEPDDLVHIRALRALGNAGVAPERRLARGAYVLADSQSRGGAGLGPRDRRLGIAHAPFEIPVGEFSDAEFAAAVDRYAAAGFGAADDVAALKLATQRVPGLLFERLALM